jgi:octanoyl-[GcvH]:protein N-octanoyltransferase
VLRLIRDRFDPPLVDTAMSAAVLRRVASGDDPPTLRLWTPERSVAFGRQDRVRPGYREAVAAVEGLGFAAVERLAGGRAAVFHEGTIAFSWAMPEARVRETIAERFRMMSTLVAAALSTFGLDARIGEVPGEYCPGEWSVNLGGRRKVMGVGQRLIKGAAHLGGVIVITGADLVNRPLVDAYRALGYDWDPDATGDLDEFAPGTTTAGVIAALIEAVGASGHAVSDGVLDEDCRRLAVDLAPDHDPNR